MTKFQYRTILLLSLAIGLVGGFMDIVVPSLLPESLRQAQKEYDAAMPLSRILFIVAVLLPALGTALVGTYGLFQFRSWAPRIALIGTALSLLTLPFLGINVQSGFSTVLSYIASYLWGALLAFAYFTPCKEWFAAKA